MPIYEYYCCQCDTEYQLIRPYAKADEPAPCGECGKPGQRQPTTFSFRSSVSIAPPRTAHTKATPAIS